MPHLSFTPNLERLVQTPAGHHEGSTVRDVLEAAFADRPTVRGYVLDDRGRLRMHVIVFVDGEQVVDRVGLTDPVAPDSSIYVAQALSGG